MTLHYREHIEATDLAGLTKYEMSPNQGRQLDDFTFKHIFHCPVDYHAFSGLVTKIQAFNA